MLKKYDNHISMIFGIGALAIFTFFLLRSIENNLSATEYGEFAAFWSLLMGVILGFTYPLETFGLATKNRNLSKREIHFEEWMAIKTVIMPIFFGLLFFSPLYIKKAFDGKWTYSILLIICLTSFAVIYSSRARLLNRKFFNRYGTLLSIEGLLRISIVFFLFNAASKSGLNAAIAITVSAAIVAGISHKWSGMSRFPKKFMQYPNSGVVQKIVLANLATITILNLSPFLIKLLQDDNGLSGKELNSLTIARIPIFLGPVIQSILIPRIQLHLNNSAANVKYFLKKFVFASIIIYLVGIIVFGVFGKKIVEFIYGPESTSSQTNFYLIASTTALYLIFITIQSYFVALNDTGTIGNAALIGLFSFIFVMLLPVDVLIRTEIASASAFAVALSYSVKTFINKRLFLSTIRF